MFRRFEVLGAFKTVEEFSSGRRWASAAAGGVRRAELPGPNTVLRFAP
ncbi:MAG: hypothetical protein ACRENB_04415 [Gemmatimonadales bacterium]